MWTWIKNLFKRQPVVHPDTDVREPIPVVSKPVEVPPQMQPDPIKKDHYAHLDPNHVVPSVPLQMALNYLDAHLSSFPNKKYIAIMDYSQHSSKQRLYLIDMNSGAVERHACAHGIGSDRDNDGYATVFSNVPGSNMSSLGFVKSAEIYTGNHPHSMKLDGLSASNSNIRARSVVMHPCAYIFDNAAKNGDHNGRSEGCLALDADQSRAIVDKLYGGCLILCWHPQFKI
jgi:hypothetical protein